MNYRNPIRKMEKFLSKQSLDNFSLGNLMDQIKYPCLIWDKPQNKILQVNSELISLTAFTREDLSQITIESLINEFEPENTSDSNRSIEIKRKNKTSIKCLFELIPLNDPGNLLLMIFRSVNYNILSDKNSFLQYILDLMMLSENKSADEYLKHIIEKLTDIYHCDNICFYLSEDSSRNLKKIRTTEQNQVFPQEILISEINFNEKNAIWKPGKRVLNDIQRSARSNGITLLITFPMIINERIKGLFVLSSRNELDSENTYDHLPLMGQIIKVNLQKIYNEMGNYQKALEINNRALILDCILRNVKMGILVINDDRKIIETNSYLEQLLGFSKWEIINNPVESILTNITLKNKNDKKEIKEKPRSDLLLNLSRRDGSEFPAQLLILPISFLSDFGEESIILLVINDLTQIGQLEAKNKQMARQADIGVLVSSFAHDVRNVFNSIKLSAEMVALKSESDPSIIEYAENIKEDCDRINQLMESVLTFSSSIEENLQPVDIIFLLQRLIERWNPKFERANVKSIFQFEKDIPKISGDPRSLEQVFNNLFSNAREAMVKTGGTLGVYISKAEQINGSKNVIIKISDSGPGIPDEFLSKIFDPYFSSRPGGTGLGLAITKRIIELHHGQIEVESFPGGTSFIVTLPEVNNGENR
jgi:two-component system, NtrC family, sensor histidine kinase AtoS